MNETSPMEIMIAETRWMRSNLNNANNMKILKKDRNLLFWTSVTSNIENVSTFVLESCEFPNGVHDEWNLQIIRFLESRTELSGRSTQRNRPISR